MSNYVNTVDVIGDKALTNSIIDRSITSFTDGNIQHLGDYALYGCRALTYVDLWSVVSIDDYAFTYCPLTALILRPETLVPSGAYPCGSTPIKDGTGYIYVPKALVSSYKEAANWNRYANQFRALEDYTVDGTITGALDETKI